MKKVFLVSQKTDCAFGYQVTTNFKVCTTLRAAKLWVESLKLLFGEAPNEEFTIEELMMVNGFEAENYYQHRLREAQK